MEPDDDILNDSANVPLAADLRRLAEAIDQSAYPGRAWPVRRHAVLRIYWLPAIAAAVAAAVLLLAVLISQWHAPVRMAPPSQVARVVQPQTGPGGQGDWDVPADIDPSLAGLVQPSLAGQLDIEIPSVPSLSIPLLGGSFTWSVPQMDLVPKIDLDRNVPADDSQTDAPQTNGKEEKA